MASKQLGKLRQWAGEVISLKDKSPIAEEFQDLEKDIELRKEGAQRLHLASEAYHHALSRKKLNEALADSDKLLPVDALGIVMIVHGEEFPEDSDYGTSLIKFGRAHCKAATLQEAYALTFKDTFITSIEKFREEIKEYEGLRKKLESRKGALDSAVIRYDKSRSSKKDKEKQEAEEEVERAQQRYDETAEDMRAHIHEIQEKEIAQQKELTHFLDIEINYVQQYLDVLRDARDDWPDKSSPTKRIHQNSISRTRPTISSPIAISTSQSTLRPAADSSEDETEDRKAGSRLVKHRKSGSTGSKPPSRPPSRPSSRLSSRRRANSNTQVQSTEDKDSRKEVDKEKDENGRPRRFSVAGWASTAVESISTRGGKGTPKDKDKDSFASLDDSTAHSPKDEGTPTILKKSSSFSLGRRLSRRKKSKENIPTVSPKVPPRILKPPSLQGARVVHALYDFNGSADELSFKAGNDITVVNEVVEGWWMGELDGRKGLFPTTHVSITPPKLTRPSWNGGTILTPPPGSADFQQEGYVTSDLDEEFSYHQPLAHNRSPINPNFDIESITSQEEETSPKITRFSRRPRRFSDDLDDHLDQPPKNNSLSVLTTPRVRNMLLGDSDPANQPLISRSASEGGQAHTPTGSPTKKAPPPPPPRRYTNPGGAGASPAIPVRRLGPAVPPRPTTSSSANSQSTSSSNESMTTSFKNHGAVFDVSPFESAAELLGSDGLGVCRQFRQNPFQPEGMCSSCRQYHS